MRFFSKSINLAVAAAFVIASVAADSTIFDNADEDVIASSVAQDECGTIYGIVMDDARFTTLSE